MEEALQFFGVAGGWEAGVARANEGAGFVFEEMGERLAERDGKIFQRGGGRYAKDGFAEAKGVVGGAF